MKAGWQTNKLGDVCSFLNRGISPKYLETGGICVLNQKCIRNHEINFDLARRHDASAKSVSAERLVQFGDVLINSTGTGTLGRVAQLRHTPNEPTTVDSHVTIARPLQGKFFSDFFGYMLVFIEEAIKEAGEGCGGQTELARSALAERFTVTYPIDQLEQQRIVAILDAAFADIATAKTNAGRNLQNARALFDSYLKSVFTNCGEGWIETTLDKCCEQIFAGGDVPKDRLAKERSEKFNVPIYSNGAKDDGLYGFTDVPRVTKPSITISARGTIGFAIIRTEPFFPVVRLIVLTPKEGLVDISFLHYVVLGMNFQNTGTSIPQLTVPNLEGRKLYVPTVEQQKLIAVKLDALFNETQRLETIYQQKISALDELKKSLLHQAFSGSL